MTGPFDEPITPEQEAEVDRAWGVTPAAPAPEPAAADVEALACEHEAHVLGCQSCDEDAERFIAFGLGDEWLARRDEKRDREAVGRVVERVEAVLPPFDSDLIRVGDLRAALTEAGVQ